MSLMRMVTKVAIGFALAKGIQKVQQSGGLSQTMDKLKDQARTAGAGAGGTGGLSDMMGRLGENGGSLGGLGGLLGGLAATRSGDAQKGQSLEELLSQDNPAEEPEPADTSGLMIRAMIFAARCDGEIDDAEKQTLMATIGEDATAEDMAFVQAAMQEPVNAQTIADETPQGVETQVYSMSVMAIEPDHPAEARYLHELASALGISEATVNEIHDSFAVPRLYG